MAPYRSKLAGQMPLLSLIVLCAVTALLTNRFLSPLNLTNILVQSSIMAVIAMGMTFVIVGGGFDLSVGSTAALAGCVASMVMLVAGVPTGIVAGIIAGAAVGLANGLVIAFLSVNPFITTLGTMVLVRGVVFLITGGAPVSGETGLPGEFIALGSERVLGIHYLVWIPAILLVVLSFLMHSTPYGRRIYATGGGREAAYLSGVPVRRVIASTYVWCGALAGIAGVMLAARLQSGQPTAGEFYELTAIAAVVLGGAALHGGEGTLYKSSHWRIHHDRARQRAQPAQCRFFLAARCRGSCYHCRGGRGKVTLARLKRRSSHVEASPRGARCNRSRRTCAAHAGKGAGKG